MTLKEFFEKTVETRDNHSEKNLKTHYYSDNYPHVRDAFLAIAETMDYQIRNVNDQHKEIFLEHKNHYVTVTIMQMNPSETAVDLKVGMYTLLGLNRPRTIVGNLYKALAKKIDFKGVGLYKK